ncbi:hypothetical protein A6R68_04334 [Neotoma lepida]|uniref:Uncharacterized protein n=1 Tax=Neotoma lepida TaxID=56216 RepID=A0A1A6GN26_NEOLE|nr:hypothetical protein A6R68_04334 [Neotoma lepida]
MGTPWRAEFVEFGGHWGRERVAGGRYRPKAEQIQKKDNTQSLPCNQRPFEDLCVAYYGPAEKARENLKDKNVDFCHLGEFCHRFFDLPNFQNVGLAEEHTCKMKSINMRIVGESSLAPGTSWKPAVTLEQVLLTEILRTTTMSSTRSGISSTTTITITCSTILTTSSTTSTTSNRTSTIITITTITSSGTSSSTSTTRSNSSSNSSSTITTRTTPTSSNSCTTTTSSITSTSSTTSTTSSTTTTASITSTSTTSTTNTTCTTSSTSSRANKQIKLNNGQYHFHKENKATKKIGAHRKQIWAARKGNKAIGQAISLYCTGVRDPFSTPKESHFVDSFMQLEVCPPNFSIIEL